MVRGALDDAVQGGERLRQRLAVVVEQGGATAGAAVDAERQFDEVAESLALEGALLGEEFEMEAACQFGTLPGEQLTAELMQHLGRLGLIEEDPEVSALVTGVLEQGSEAETAEHVEQTAGVFAQVGADLFGEDRLRAGLLDRGLVHIKVEGEEGAGAVETEGIDADGVGAEKVVFGNGGGERFMHGTVATFAAGVGPLAGVGVFPAGEQGGEANAVGIGGRKAALIGRLFDGGGGTAQSGGGVGRESRLDGPVEGGTDAGLGPIIAEDVEIEPEPVFAGGIGGEETFKEGGGASGIAAFAVVMSEAKGGDGVVGIVAKGELELAEGEVDESGLFGEKPPVGVTGAFVEAGIGGAFDVAQRAEPSSRGRR